MTRKKGGRVMTETKETTWQEKMATIGAERLACINEWLCYLRDENTRRLQPAAVAALVEPGGKQYQAALVLFGAQQQLEALVKEIARIIEG